MRVSYYSFPHFQISRASDGTYHELRVAWYVSRGGWLSHGKIETGAQIERATCGLRILDSPTSDNLTPQETTKEEAPEVGTDGAGLSCPGSSVVAEE